MCAFILNGFRLFFIQIGYLNVTPPPPGQHHHTERVSDASVGGGRSTKEAKGYSP